MYTISVLTFLCLFIHQSVAVTLQDFTPRQTDLKGDCETVYNSTISGCQSSDFQGSKCSISCATGLLSLGVSVRQSCVGQGTSDSVIAAFLNGQGVSDLCPKGVSSAASTTSLEKAPIIGSGTMVLSSTGVSSTGVTADTTSSASPSRTRTALSTATIQPLESLVSITSTVGTALAFASSTPASVIEAATQTSDLTSTTKKAESTQTTEGGSPFDTSDAPTQVAFHISSLALALLASALIL